MKIKGALLFLAFACLIHFFASSPRADQALLRTQLVELLDDLPSPKSNRKAILYRESVKKFRPVLLAPIAAWVEADLIRSRVYRSLNFSWDFGESWASATQSNLGLIDLSEENSLIVREGANLTEGFPFGEAIDIEQEQDLVRKAYKILWNVATVGNLSRNIAIDGRISWFGTQRVLRESRAFLFREYSPSGDGSAEPAKSIFSETFRLIEPAVVSGYATKTSRFLEAKLEDHVRHYSPVIAASRDLLAANRSDEILEGSISLDDLFVFSNKVESVKARVVGSKVILVPYSSLNEEKIIPADRLFSEFSRQGVVPELGGSEASTKLKKVEQQYSTVLGGHTLKDGTNTFTVWNFDVAAFNSHAPWMPLTMYFVPRRVWILELFPRDPYYSSGKSILVVDSESMLPIYKIVHDRKGEVLKTVLGAWGFAKSSDGKKRIVFPGFILSVNRNARKATTFASQRIQTYGQDISKVRDELAPLIELPKEQEPETEEDTDSEA